jgi:hypothetical protein
MKKCLFEHLYDQGYLEDLYDRGEHAERFRSHVVRQRKIAALKAQASLVSDKLARFELLERAAVDLTAESQQKYDEAKRELQEVVAVQVEATMRKREVQAELARLNSVIENA